MILGIIYIEERKGKVNIIIIYNNVLIFKYLYDIINL